MVDYIRSNTIKKYLKENKIVLTDEMTAALIANRSHINGMEKTHEALREIQEQTEDGILKKQIQRYIDDDLANLEELKASVRGDFYELSVWDERDREEEILEYYQEYESAERMAQTLGERCMIRKHHAVQKSGDDYRLEGARHYEAQFNKEGKLFYVLGSSNHLDEMEEWFEEKYYIFPHPYKRGDILELAGDKDALFIVVEDADPAVVEAERKRREWLHMDYSDINISVASIDRATGRIWDTDGWMHPYDFEYAHIEPDTEDLAERIMHEIQKLLLGKWGSVQFIYDACLRLKEEYMESEKRVSLITGMELRPWNVRL